MPFLKSKYTLLYFRFRFSTVLSFVNDRNLIHKPISHPFFLALHLLYLLTIDDSWQPPPFQFSVLKVILFTFPYSSVICKVVFDLFSSAAQIICWSKYDPNYGTILQSWMPRQNVFNHIWFIFILIPYFISLHTLSANPYRNNQIYIIDLRWSGIVI